MCNNLVPPVNTIGFDQGVHNFIIHNNLVDVKIVKNNTGQVLTMGYMNDKDVLFNENEDRVVNENGVVINTLHQWDRKPFIMEKLKLGCK
jgi:hypothetical protein